MANRSPVMQEYKPLVALSKLSPAARPRLKQTLMDWSARHFRSYSEVEAYNLISGTRQVVAEVMASKDMDAERTAENLVSAANSFEPARKLIHEMAQALENCLECKGLDWAAEHDCDIMIRRAKEFLRE